MREPIQIGAELYGHAGLEADVEIVRLMIAALKRAGVERLHIDLGNPAIYRALAGNAGLRGGGSVVPRRAAEGRASASGRARGRSPS